MRLYTFAHAPNPLKARLALAELGLEYEPIEVNLLEWEQHSEEFLAINPHAKLPVLQDGSLTLRESDAILSYLGKCYGKELWPQDVASEALALQWLFFEAVHLAAPLATMFWTDRIVPVTGLPGSSPEVITDNMDELARSLGVLEGHLATSQWILGDRFTLVDCALGVAASMMPRTRMDQPEKWPNFFAYGERFRARPSWEQAGGPGLP